jgi:hypothetical protein
MSRFCKTTSDGLDDPGQLEPDRAPRDSQRVDIEERRGTRKTLLTQRPVGVAELVLVSTHITRTMKAMGERGGPSIPW